MERRSAKREQGGGQNAPKKFYSKGRVQEISICLRDGTSYPLLDKAKELSSDQSQINQTPD